MTVAELVTALQACPDQSAPVMSCCPCEDGGTNEPVEQVFTMFAGVVLLMRADP